MVNIFMRCPLTESKPGDFLSGLPGYALRRAANAMMAELSARLGTLDLKISDATVLLLVGRRDDMTSSEIGKVLDIQRANMVPLLNRLEGAALVERVPIDRKSMAIVLTLEGRQKLEQVQALSEQFEAHLLSLVPEEHRPHLLPALQALFTWGDQIG